MGSPSKEEKILNLIFENSPLRQWHFNEIVEEAKVNRSVVNKWLKRYVKEGLLKKIKEPYVEEKEMKIFYDKNKDQYTVRIPKEFANAVSLNPKKNKFKFTLITPSLEEKNQETKLKGELN